MNRSRRWFFAAVQTLVLAWLVVCAMVWDNAWLEWTMKHECIVASSLVVLIVQEWAFFRVLRWNSGGLARGRFFSQDQGGGGLE